MFNEKGREEEEEEGGQRVLELQLFSPLPPPLRPFLSDPLNCGLHVPCGAGRGDGERASR